MKTRRSFNKLGVMMVFVSALLASSSSSPQTPAGAVTLDTAQFDFLQWQRMCVHHRIFFPNSRKCPGDRYA